MNQILSGLAGALILAALYGTLLLARKIGKGAAGLTAALNGIPQLVKSNMEVASALHRFSGELEFLRTAMLGGTPEAEPGAAASPTAQPRPRGGPIPSFPQWQPFVAAPADIPDAEESDTEVIDTPDEEFVQQEQIDEIRGQGFAAGPEADPTYNPPGVTANV
jgi:hypothetical protein